MSTRTVFICDGCDAEADAQSATCADARPAGWMRADIRVFDVALINAGQSIMLRDLCPTCQERLAKHVDPKDWPREAWPPMSDSSRSRV